MRRAAGYLLAVLAGLVFCLVVGLLLAHIAPPWP